VHYTMATDDASSLTSFFFYVFFIHPATAWILKPGRFEWKKSIVYAILFLAAIAGIKTGMEYNDRGPNHYVRLGVTRSSSPLDIKRAYKKLSLQLHPDKNPSPDAADMFDEVKKAYDVLMDLEFHSVYDKFGQDGIDSNKRFDESQFFMELGIFYVTWALLVFVLTLGKKSGDARQWCYTGMVVMLVAEITLMTSPTNPIPEWLLPQTTEHELVWLMHSLYPAFMNGCRSLGSYLYVDLEAQTKKLLFALQEQNKDILLVLREVQIGVQTIESNGVKTTNSGHASARGPGAPRVTATGKLKELQDRLQTGNANVAEAVKSLKGDQTQNSQLGFYMMILGFVAMSYIFN